MGQLFVRPGTAWVTIYVLPQISVLEGWRYVSVFCSALHCPAWSWAASVAALYSVCFKWWGDGILPPTVSPYSTSFHFLFSKVPEQSKIIAGLLFAWICGSSEGQRWGSTGIMTWKGSHQQCLLGAAFLVEWSSPLGLWDQDLVCRRIT